MTTSYRLPNMLLLSSSSQKGSVKSGKAQQFSCKWRDISPVICLKTSAKYHPSLFLKHFMSVCVCGQGEGQHQHDFSTALFQVITNKGQWGLWPLIPRCQRETPYQSLCSSEGLSSSKVTASKPSHGRWERKLLVSRVMRLLYCIHHCGRLWFATLDGM